MEIKKASALYFSPTGGTKKIAERIAACDTGSDVSPPGGETAPMAVTEPLLSSEPRHSTTPARS